MVITPLPPTQTPTPTATPVPPPDLLFRDGFESGNLSAWSSSVTDGSDLSVTTAAALTGTYGLQALIDDRNSIYATQTLASQAQLRARFYFDPNAITMANGDAHVIFQGSANTFRVEFQRANNSYQLRATLNKDTSNGWTYTNWFTISDEPHSIELYWVASTGPGANNGSLTLWIDDVQQQSITGIDNDTRRVTQVDLGAVSGVDRTTAGTTYFDAVEIRQSSYIGPVICGTGLALQGAVITQQELCVPPPTPTPTPTFTPTPDCPWYGQFDGDHSCIHAYEPTRAIGYAEDYKATVNNHFCGFTYGGTPCYDPQITLTPPPSDCTNFISQALHDGGLPMVAGSDGWWCSGQPCGYTCEGEGCVASSGSWFNAFELPDYLMRAPINGVNIPPEQIVDLQTYPGHGSSSGDVTMTDPYSTATRENFFRITSELSTNGLKYGDLLYTNRRC